MRYFLLIGFFLVVSFPRVRALRRYFRKLDFYQRETVRLEKENKTLVENLYKIKNDPFTIEKLAREIYGLMKNGEYAFRIGNKDVSP
jgi:cell division protein FtsB